MGIIIPRVHLIEGVEMSPGEYLNLYLVEEQGGKLTLVDTGLPGSLPKVRAYIERNRMQLSQIGRIIITHVHPDHVGSLKAVVDATRAKTFAHWIEAAFIAQKPKYDGPPRHSFNIEPVEVDERLKDGDQLDVLGGLQVIHTPGHTPGHISLYSSQARTFFTGDLFFHERAGLVLTPPEYTHHLQSAIISAKRASSLDFENLLTYHGPPVIGVAKQRVSDLVKKL